MDKKIQQFENMIKIEYSNIAGIVVSHCGNLLYECYFNGYNSNDTLNIASVTKGIVSALIGIAYDNGYIKSVHQNVLDFFPNYTVKRGESTIQNITIQNILTMTAPYKYKSEPYTKVYTSDDWTKSALDLLGGKNNTYDFKYSTVGTQVLSGIITNATGQSVTNFAKKYLFDPLKIKTPPNIKINNKDEYLSFLKDKYVNGWIVDPQNINTAGWGLTLTTRDITKIGELYLNDGIWDNEQILSTKWINDSTQEKSRFGKLSYGYMWWIDGDCYIALGDGGSAVFVCPKNKIVVGITSIFMPRAKDRVELIKKYILPLFI